MRETAKGFARIRGFIWAASGGNLRLSNHGESLFNWLTRSTEANGLSAPSNGNNGNTAPNWFVALD